jgi:hypothetical protein
MKNNLFLPVFAAFYLSLCFSCSHFHNNHYTNISISESAVSFRLSAYFNENKTRKVQRYINRCVEPNGLFSNENGVFDANTILDDKTKFYIKSRPGELLIKLNKRENSDDSYIRIKKMCEGIKGVIEDK